jgi:dephospho-CoA kinase
MSTERRAPDAGDTRFVIGLVGRTGSGKSTVARALAEDGATVIPADALGHEVTDHDPEVRAALIAEYGPGVYRDGGALDRAQVAARVFTDSAARARLDRLVHPRIIDRIRDRIESMPGGVIVIDAALLLDWGLERWCDAVIAVESHESDQMARLQRERGWSAEEARRRLSVQRPAEAFRAAADVTLENHGTPEALAAAARAVVSELRARRAAPRRKEC